MADLYFDIKQKAEENNAALKKYLLLVPKEEDSPGSVTLIKAIISALKLDLDCDFDLIFVPSGGASMGRKLSNYKKVLVLGCDAEQLDLQLEVKKYKILYPEGQELLFADLPSALSGDTAKKGQLWKCLQLMFELIKA